MTCARGLFTAVALFLLVGLAAAEEQKKQLPEKARAILQKAEQIELLSLDPDFDTGKVKDGFRGWKVLGKTTLKEAKERKKLLDAVETGVAEAGKFGAKCFDPRHGIRATADGKTVDLVICYACSWIYVYYDKDPDRKAAVVTSNKQEGT